MPNPDLIKLIVVLVVLLILLVGLTWLSPQSTAKLRESLFRNVGMPGRNLIGFLLGALAALLLLTSNTWSISWASWFFVSVLAVLMFLLVVVRPNVEKELDRFAWGLLVIIILGFGTGSLIYQARSWWIWLWNKYRLINEPHELVLEFLFILGVILGVFVVRNWAKEQEAFTKSLSALLGGTFIAGVFGESLKGQGLTTIGALTYYGLGFVMSAAVNLLLAARLTANYTNKRSISSRALLDFLYGSERAKLIDGYFLQNFKDDPDYAKLALTETLLEFRKLIQREFAERLEQRRKNRTADREAFPASSAGQAALFKLRQLSNDSIEARILSNAGFGDDEPVQEQIELETNEILKDLLKQTKPSFFYQLLAIESEDQKAEPDDAATADPDPKYSIVYKHIGSSSPQATRVEENMFRVGVSVRWQDNLETITAPGQYRVPFPYRNSVAGLALEFRQVIVMDRDIRKRFRNKEHPDGISPKDIEQDRGLDEIEYLSYVAIPIVSRAGSPGENPVGVVTVDTRLFVTHSKLEGAPIKASEGIFRTDLKRSELSDFAVNLYDQDDADVKYVESLTRIITPVLELYSKCRVGAT